MSSPKGHLPPAGMQNHSGALVTKLARAISDAVAQNSEHLTPDVVASVLATIGVDLWRASLGDEDGRCAPSLCRTIQRRCEKPPEYWGVTAKS